MDLKISQLPQAFFIGVGDLLVLVQGGVTSQFTSPIQIDSDGNVTVNDLTSAGVVNVQEIHFPDGTTLSTAPPISAGRIFAISNIFCV